MKFYAVHRGVKPGIYATWDECKKQVDGFNGPIYKKFDNKNEAEIFFKNGFNQKTFQDKYSKKINNSKKTDEKNEKILDDLLKNTDNKVFAYTDGSCITFKNGITKAGYGIYIPMRNIKVSEPLINQKQTNNRAELTAILECVNHLSEDDLKNEIIIITDSKYSMYIFDGTGERYEKDNYMKEGKQVLNKDLVIKALKIKRKYNIRLVKIRAHTNKDDIHTMNNDIVDKLAKSGVYKNVSTFNEYDKYNDKDIDTSIYSKYHDIYQKLPDNEINNISKNITMNDIFEYDECSESTVNEYKNKNKNKLKNNESLSQWFIPIKKK
jgi:ribonuclease HI